MKMNSPSGGCFFRGRMLAIFGLERKNGVFFGENLDGGDFWKKSILHFSQKNGASSNQSV
jgi:hypothetical protein